MLAAAEEEQISLLPPQPGAAAAWLQSSLLTAGLINEEEAELETAEMMRAAGGPKYAELDDDGDEAARVQDDGMAGIELRPMGGSVEGNLDGEEDGGGGGNDDSALVSGGPVDIWRWRNAGYLMQYFVVGLIYGGPVRPYIVALRQVFSLDFPTYLAALPAGRWLWTANVLRMIFARSLRNQNDRSRDRKLETLSWWPVRRSYADARDARVSVYKFKMFPSEFGMFLVSW